MKLITIILMTTILQVSANSYAQKVTLDLKNASLDKVFREIRKQTDFDFFYPDNLALNTKKVSINIKDLDLNEALKRCLEGQPLIFSIENHIIVIRSKPISLPNPISSSVKLSISGKVLTEKNEPFAGVVVKEKGNPRNQTATNRAGEFTIQIEDEKAVLLFSYIGYDAVEIKSSEIKSPYTLKMKVSLNDLDQVQVTAFGTTTKRLNAGNITTITSKDIEKNPVNNVFEALQGKVPGLFIQQVTGQPGGAFSLRLRNSANLTTGAAPPLIVVDGVRYPGSVLPLSKNTSYGTQNFLQGGNGLNYLNPNDIESIDVLKDVDATAIYGSSGAYGVILITTKKAKQITQSFNANIWSGVSVNGQVPPLLNTEQYLMLRREAIANDNLTVSASDLDLNGTWPADRYTDWQKEFMGGSAVTSNVNLSYSGGNQNTSYLISGSLRDMGNIQRHKGNNGDGSLRFALNTNTSDNKFSLSLTGTYLSSKNDMVPYDFSTTSAILVPNAPSPYKADGTIDWNAIGTNVNSSAPASNSERLYKNITNNLLANATLVYRPTSKITLRSIFGYNSITGKENIGYPTTTMNPSTTNAASQTVGIFHHYNTRSITVSPYAEYKTTIGKKGEFSVKIGGEIGNKVEYQDEIMGRGFPSDGLLDNPSAGSTVTTLYDLTENRSIGMYGILKMVWDNKYIIDINTRRDGSTKFGPGRRFGNFGSAAVAWIFSEEGFVKNNLPFLSFGKLRVSSGVVGGDAISDFAYLGTYSVMGGAYDGKIGLQPNSLPNPILNWERNFNSEAGLELGFFNDRVSTEFSYYYNRAGNQLLSQPLSSVTGYNSYALNSDALIRNSGLEVSLSSTNVKTKNFNWNTRFNISIPKSKLLRLPSQTQDVNYVLNQPITGILLYKYNGVNPQTGNYSFTNAKGETADYTGGLTQVDRTEFIDLAPKYFGGITNAITYKNLTLDFSFTFTNRIGKNFLGQTIFPFGMFGTNGSTQWLNRWQKPGDETAIPKLTSGFGGYFRQDILINSTGAYGDAKYARLQNASLRYNFGPKMLKALHVKNLSLYAQGQNLLTISNFDGLDPENLSAGVIPPLRIYTFGLNLSL